LADKNFVIIGVIVCSSVVYSLNGIILGPKEMQVFVFKTLAI
jgi:hypothetical protein